MRLFSFIVSAAAIVFTSQSATALTATPENCVHVSVPGDTYSALALKYSGNADNWYRWSASNDYAPTEIPPGVPLRIPGCVTQADRIAELSDQIDDLETRLGRLESDVEDNTWQLSNLRDDVERQSEDLQALADKVKSRTGLVPWWALFFAGFIGWLLGQITSEATKEDQKAKEPEPLLKADPEPQPDSVVEPTPVAAVEPEPQPDLSQPRQSDGTTRVQLPGGAIVYDRNGGNAERDLLSYKPQAINEVTFLGYGPFLIPNRVTGMQRTWLWRDEIKGLILDTEPGERIRTDHMIFTQVERISIDGESDLDLTSQSGSEKYSLPLDLTIRVFGSGFTVKSEPLSHREMPAMIREEEPGFCFRCGEFHEFPHPELQIFEQEIWKTEVTVDQVLPDGRAKITYLIFSRQTWNTRP